MSETARIWFSILLERGFLSRKQLRGLQSQGAAPKSPEELRRILLEGGYLDPPDWREAEPLLKSSLRASSNPNRGADEAGDNNAVPDGESTADSNNAIMQQIQQTALRVASADTTVLLLGESGVGKSRLAARIHDASPRRAAPFITVSCGSIPETLLESELFGVEKGAYTGANKSRAGRFQRAEGGTVFLDEIGELTPPLQVKLLRVLQERKIEPLGGQAEIDVNVRLVAATNRDLEADVREGRFRQDLYFRLNVVPLTLPPLRERPEDVLALAERFTARMSAKLGRSLRLHDPDDPRIEQILTSYSWPGNIRELENCIERLSALAREDGQIRVEDFPPRILEETGLPRAGRRDSNAFAPARDPVGAHADDFPTLRELEERHVRAALESGAGRINRAAELLGVHRNTLKRKLEDFGLDARRFRKRK